MDPQLIRLEGITFGYAPERPVLIDCDFDLQASERVALTGANGSGKTTLLAMIVGLVRPLAGRIVVFGRPRRAEKDFGEVRRRVGFLFQDSDDQLFCPTVAEEVAFGPLNLGHPRATVRELVAETLARLGLSGYEHRITYQLSGGEKRLVALASVLAMQPEVLLLDEPTAGLDDRATGRVTEALAGLGQAMVIASHDRAFRRALATRGVAVADRRLVPASD